jgi:hypothetical protein
MPKYRVEKQPPKTGIRKVNNVNGFNWFANGFNWFPAEKVQNLQQIRKAQSASCLS